MKTSCASPYVVRVEFTDWTILPMTSAVLARGAMRLSCATQGRTKSPRSTSSKVRSIWTVACLPCRESTLATPTVFVWRASVRCEIGSTMGPSGRKINSLSPGRAGTSSLKRAYAVS